MTANHTFPPPFGRALQFNRVESSQGWRGWNRRSSSTTRAVSFRRWKLFKQTITPTTKKKQQQQLISYLHHAHRNNYWQDTPGEKWLVMFLDELIVGRRGTKRKIYHVFVPCEFVCLTWEAFVFIVSPEMLEFYPTVTGPVLNRQGDAAAATAAGQPIVPGQAMNFRTTADNNNSGNHSFLFLQEYLSHIFLIKGSTLKFSLLWAVSYT